MLGEEFQKKYRRFGGVMKTYCDKCKRRCNTFDKSRGMPCKDFERKDAKTENSKNRNEKVNEIF